ncbi:mitochondrial basic amino acids transporter-like [Antedon mediterranea]|uniref:mitochondrial basic amino acids transporter-like n=1 Tax=Antedon mediterranea TaxID=105859 RepID=UPI003AF8E546
MAFNLPEFIAGGTAGVAGTVVGHPLDTIKIRLQNQGTVTRYKSGFECFLRILKQESVTGLYKGLLSPVVASLIQNSFYFGVEETFLAYLGGASTRNHYIAGAGVGLLGTSFMCPLDLTKIRLQMQGIGTKHVAKAQKHYNNSIEAIYTIFKKEGLRGCYHGLGINIVRDVPSTGVYFSLDHYLSNKIASYSTGNKASTAGLFVAGGLAGTLSWFVIYPLDVIKSRWQADGVGSTRLYSSYVDCFMQCTKKEGWGILFKGVSVTMFRGIPVNGVIFVVYKHIKQRLNADTL